MQRACEGLVPTQRPACLGVVPDQCLALDQEREPEAHTDCEPEAFQGLVPLADGMRSSDLSAEHMGLADLLLLASPA